MAKQERKDVKLKLKSYNFTLPYNKAMEEAVLGAVLISKDAFFTVSRIILHRDIFAFEIHRIIWDACIRLTENKIPIDLLTITSELGKEKEKLETIGGPYYLVELTNRVASDANMEFHARILVQYWIRARLMQNFYKNMELAESDEMDCFDILSKAQNELALMTDFITKTGNGQDIETALKDMRVKIRNPELMKKNYIYSGIQSFDAISTGFGGGELIILAGRPGSGKTTIGIDLAVRMAVNFGVPCSFFSYEMGTEELLYKMVSNICEINGKKFKNPETLEEYELVQIEAAFDKIEKSPLVIHDSGGLDATQIRSVITAEISRHNTKIVFIDYLQIMPMMKGTERMSTADAIGNTTRMLKNIAKELKITIVLMSQLNRDCEKNKYARPRIENLRDSGHIESDADRVILIWRPFYHKYYTIDYNGQEMDTYGKVCVIIEKFRNGEPDEVWLRAQLEYSKFDDLQGSYLDTIEKPDSAFWQNFQQQPISLGNGGGQLSDDLPF